MSPIFVAEQVDPSGRVKVIVDQKSSAQIPISFKDGSGLSMDIIQAINQSQDKYYFEAKAVATKQLQKQIKNNSVDIASFHNLKWGWEGQRLNRSLVMLHGSDVFVTLKAYKKAGDYLELGPEVSKLGVKGYHYRFNYGVKDEAVLKRDYNMTLLGQAESIITAILNKEAQVGVISTITLHYLKKTRPDDYEKLKVSRRYDSIYDMYYLISQEAPISHDEFNACLQKIAANGLLQTIYQQYGLPLPEWAKKAKPD